MRRWRMLARVLMRAAWVRPRRTLIAVAAVAIASATITAVLALYLDTATKLHEEFRGYGANLLLTGKPGATLPDADQVQRMAGSNSVASPIVFAIAQQSDGKPMVVAGVNFNREREMNSWWSVTAWPNGEGEALAGARTATAHIDTALRLTYESRPIDLAIRGIVNTGGEEDSRVYINLADFVRWTGLKPNTMEVLVAGSAERIEQVAAALQRQFPNLELKPIRQIVEAEGRVFEKTRSTVLAVSIAIAVISCLCLFATLVAAVLDRRRDLALMKALGAGRMLTTAMFATENAMLGAAGAIVGFLVGLAVAGLIEARSLGASLSPNLALLLPVVGGSILVCVVAAVVSMRAVAQLEPAAVLKGE